ncbi:16136_t:CDS:1, partial [Rhizophagus irregularis]
MKSQLNILGALFNTPVLREIAIQKVYNTLSEIWYPTIPSNINTYIDHIAKPTYLTKALGLLNHYGFSINFTFDINILGGNTPIRDYMSDLSIADIQSLKAKNIIYMDQVVSSDGNYLLSWPDVKRNNNNNYSGPISAWYKKLTDNYVLSNNLRLIHPLNDVVCDISRTHKSPPTMPAITTPKSQWSIHWNNVQKQVIFGKTLSQDTDHSTSISYLQHFIPQQTHYDNNLTPKKQLLGLVACKGCLLHSYYPHDTRPTCVIAIRTQKLLLFNIFKKSSSEYKSLLEFYNHQIFVVATKPFHTLRHIAYEHFTKIDKSPLNNPSQRPLDVTLTPYTSLPSNNIDNHIDHALICHPDLKIELKSCAKKLELENLLTFYTDGSVQHIGTTHSISGYGWTQ